MSLPLVLTAAAESDLDDAATWYERQSTGLGQEFLDQVDECLNRIASISPRCPSSLESLAVGFVRRLSTAFPMAFSTACNLLGLR